MAASGRRARATWRVREILKAVSMSVSAGVVSVGLRKLMILKGIKDANQNTNKKETG
jgi:hypothetical protein